MVVPVARQGLDLPALKAGWRNLAAAVVAGGLLGPLLLVTGLARTPPATASLLLNLELVATVALAAAFFREHIGPKVAAGAALVVVSGALLGWSGEAHLRLGAILVVAACVCWGIDNCLTAGLDQVSPAAITLVKGVVAGTTNLVVGLVVGGDLPGTLETAGALLIGMLGYGASTTLWVRGARGLGAARGQLVFSTAPFVGVAVSWLVLGDDARPVELIALVVVAAGVGLVIGSDHVHDHHHQALAHDHEHGHDDGHHDHGHPGLDPGTVHAHPHEHRELVHAHPHVPDHHHRHEQ